MTRDTQLLEELRQSSCQQARLLPQLLEALAWPGEGLQLRNALCGSPSKMDATDLLNTLSNLGYRWQVLRLSARSPSHWPRFGFPLLIRFESADSPPVRLAATFQDLTAAIQGSTNVLAYSFHFEPVREGEKREWFQSQVLRFRRGISELYVVSLLINLLALVLPFYIRAVYNLEIPGGQVSDLFLLLPFALIAVMLQIWLTQVRQVRLAKIGGQLDLILASRVLAKLMRLPYGQLERYTPLTLESRLRNFQSLRVYITGPLALAALDLPFIGIFLVAIAAMSLPLMGLTILMALLCFGGVWAVGALGRAFQRSLSRNPANLDSLLLEFFQDFDQVKLSGSEARWHNRLQVASAEQATQSIGVIRLQQFISILTGEFSQLTGALVLASGTALALAGDGLELGTLIASMFFVWRVFRPIQIGYQALSRWPQMQPILQQLNHLMGSTEVEPDTALTQHWVLPDPTGAFLIKNVSVRLNSLQEPALSQISLEISQGDLVVITGQEGSGCSTLLKLMDAQIPITSGVVSLDGADLRQYPLAQLRQEIAYLPQNPSVFPGTLRENLLLANPLHSDSSLLDTLQSLSLHALMERPGLDCPIALRGPRSLPPHLIQGLAIARILLTTARVRLLDEPLSRLDFPQRQAFMALLEQQKGTLTTVVVSDDPALLTIADRLVILKEGSLAFSGTPAELLAAQQNANSVMARPR